MEFSDETRELYLLSFGYPNAQILVYPRGELGQHAPQRTIVLPNFYGLLLATADQNVFTTGFAAQSKTAELLAYPKHANGSPKPTFVRMYTEFATADGVVVGP